MCVCVAWYIFQITVVEPLSAVVGSGIKAIALSMAIAGTLDLLM